MLLITGGCSFSECISPHIDTWPRHLARSLPDYTHISTAMGSQGNGLISRGIIHEVSQALKTHNPEELLVGVMWSGPERHDFYIDHPPKLENTCGWMTNPTNFVKDSWGGWIIMNPWWNEFAYTKPHYSMFHDHIGALIYTCEHILRTQWFLKTNNVPYFMSNYTAQVFPDIIKTHPDTRYLYEQIDFTRFLDVEGEYEWCRDYSNLEFKVKNDNHPSTEQHNVFNERVILPFLQSKGYI